MGSEMKPEAISNGVSRPIPGLPGYSASSDGRVFSPNGRELKQRLAHGYWIVHVVHEGRETSRGVHRLVCLAFHGEPKGAAMQAAHLDGDRTNNHSDNLAWKTQVENEADKVPHGTRAQGERLPQSKLTDASVLEIVALRQRGGSTLKALAERFGVTRGAISHVIAGRNWNHITGLPKAT